MLKKKFIYTLLLLICIIPLSSCSLLKGSKLKPKNVIKVFEEEGFAQVDIDDILDDLEDAYYSDSFSNDLEDGVYATANTKNDIRKIFDTANGLNMIGLFLEYDKDMKEACWFVRADVNSSLSGAVVGAATFRYDHYLAGNDSDVMDEIIENIEDSEDEIDEYYESFDYDVSRENGLSYILLTAESTYDGDVWVVNLGYYIQGRDMFVVYSLDIDSTRGIRQVDDICDMLDLPSPSEL